MQVPTLQVKKLSTTAQLPVRGSVGASCFDIHADSEHVIEPGQTELVKTGLSVAVPFGYEVQIRSRSGLALKKSISVLNSPGTVDCDYRGEVGVPLHNHSKVPFVVKRGDRIAQMGVYPVAMSVIEERETLDATERGVGGFGSTGVSAQPITKRPPLDIRLLTEEEADFVVNNADRLTNVVSPDLLKQGSDNLPYVLFSKNRFYLFFPDGGVYGPYTDADSEQLVDLCGRIVAQQGKATDGR